MSNERITEDIVRSHFKSDPLASVIKLEEQKSTSKKINDLLQTGSKSGTGKGFPEFLVSFPAQNSNYIIVIECKPDTTKHESASHDKPSLFAVDGALHYSGFLCAEFDVIAIAVSGQNKEELKISTFKRSKGSSEYTNENTTKLLSVNDYLKLFDNESFADNLRNIDIIQKAVYLNEEFHLYSITENARCTIVSAFLISLLDNTFKQSYSTYENSPDLAAGLIDAIKRVLKNNKVKNWDSMLGEFQKITNEPLFKQKLIKRRKEQRITIEVIKNFIDYIYCNVYPLIAMDDAGMDVLGKFYTEFIRYAGSSQKQGLVLTPYHVTELFCALANITVDSVCYDPVCGSAGFLITAMKVMLSLAQNDSAKKEEIKNRQLVGVELRPDMYTYACTNMMFRGDGKSNIYNTDCTTIEQEIIREHKPTVALLNPPYDVGNVAQLEFVEHGLRVVGHADGIVIAIVQLSCVTKKEKELKAIKQRLLEKHRLRAVISTPDDLFSPVTVNTCIMVWEANKPNKDYETWFGYLKDDGFEKRKHKGRIDARKRWAGIRDTIVKSYMNSTEINGVSVKHNVTVDDEWCAEEFMKTDYTQLAKNKFERTIQDYISFRVKSGLIDVISSPIINKNLEFDTTKWKSFKYNAVFEIKNGYYNRKPVATETGDIPFIGAIDNNNGVTEYYSLYDIETQHKGEGSIEHSLKMKLYSPNQISVSNNGSVGYAFYQWKQFTCTHDVNVLSLKDGKLNPYIAMFLCTLIEMERYRWTFGRKWRPTRMPKSDISLPVLENGKPDWNFMEQFIKSLPYSASL